MAYCTKEEVRKLTGPTDLELDYSQLEEILRNAERQANLETAKHLQRSRLLGALLNGFLGTVMFKGLARAYTT